MGGGRGGGTQNERQENEASHRNVVRSTHTEVTRKPEVLSPVFWQRILIPAAAKIWYRAPTTPDSKSPLPTSSAFLHHQPSLRGLLPFFPQRLLKDNSLCLQPPTPPAQPQPSGLEGRKSPQSVKGKDTLMKHAHTLTPSKRPFQLS